MKRALRFFASTLAIVCGLAGAASAEGVTICNATGHAVAFALGYGHAESLESAGRFESEPGKCATFLAQVANGPFYVYGREPSGIMSWTGRGDKTDQAFCLSHAARFVDRNSDHMKDGKLACPEGPAGQFILIPAVPGGTPKFTFTEQNADRP